MEKLKKNVLIILASSNFNEEEYLIISTRLKKEGVNIFIASDAFSLCTGSEGLKVKADVSFYNVHESNFSAVIFIGGEGILNYLNNDQLKEIARKFYTKGKLVAAICVAPLILAKAGLIKNSEATCYPKEKNTLESFGTIYVDKPVVISKNVLTGQSPSSSDEFADRLVNILSTKSVNF